MPHRLHFQGETGTEEEEEEEEEEEGSSTQLESDICNCRGGLQRAFEGLRERMVSVFTNDPEQCCAELWASVNSAMSSTADECL